MFVTLSQLRGISLGEGRDSIDHKSSKLGRYLINKVRNFKVDFNNCKNTVLSFMRQY